MFAKIITCLPTITYNISIIGLCFYRIVCMTEQRDLPYIKKNKTVSGRDNVAQLTYKYVNMLHRQAMFKKTGPH